MVGLALLGFALVVLMKSAANSISSARDAQMMGVVTDLARGKMYDIEETLLKDGFTDTNQSEESEQTFEEEGWPSIRYTYKVDQVELPSWDMLQDMAKRKPGQGSGSGAGSAGSGSGAGSDFVDGAGGFQNSALGGMLSSLGGGFGGGSSDIDSKQGASFIQGQYQMVQGVLKASIRKVTLEVKWDVLGSARELKVVAFFTDAAAMDKVLSGLGSQDLDDQPQSGPGSGTSTGTGKPSPTKGGTPSGKTK